MRISVRDGQLDNVLQLCGPLRATLLNSVAQREVRDGLLISCPMHLKIEELCGLVSVDVGELPGEGRGEFVVLLRLVGKRRQGSTGIVHVKCTRRS